MSSNIILECSQYKSNSTSNSQWTTTFSEEVLLEEGDVFQLQQCLLNTQTVSSGSINIENDIEVTIQVAYYEMALGSYVVTEDTTGGGSATYVKNTPLPYATSNNGANQTNYDEGFDPISLQVDKTSSPFGLYLLRNPNADNSPPTKLESDLYTADLKITILSGVYQPDALAAYITKAMMLKYDESVGGNSGSKGLLVNLSHANFHNHRMVAADMFNSSQSPAVYSRQPTTNGGYPMVGASTFELSFNSGVFSFTNLHSPMMGAVGGGDSGNMFYTNPSAGMYKTGSTATSLPHFPPLMIVECLGGCLLTDLQPRPFWASLGFTSDHIDNNILFDDTHWINLITSSLLDEVQAATPYLNSKRVKPNILMSDYRSNLNSGVSSFDYTVEYAVPDIDHEFKGPPKRNVLTRKPEHDTMMLIATTDTFTLDGDVNYVVDDIGYFRIEAETVISNNFKQQDKRLGAVVGIVSKNYNANDFVIGYGDGSSIAYQHTGVPQVISAINISVIDPLTNAPVVGMGKNSTVFLEVVKAPPQPKGKGKGRKDEEILS